MSNIQSLLESTISQNLPVFHSAYRNYMKHFLKSENDCITKPKYLENCELYGVVTGGEYEPEHTNYVAGFQATLDYIFVEQPNDEHSFHLNETKVLMLPDETSVLKNETALPNEILSSDHISLMATISVQMNSKSTTTITRSKN